MKADWIVCSNDNNPLFKGGYVEIFKSEKAALAKARKWMKDSSDIECYVYKLAIAFSRPDNLTVHRVEK